MPTIMTSGEARKAYIVADGTSLYDFMLQQNPQTGNFEAPTVAVYRGKPVMRVDWATTVLNGNDVAVFVTLPMKGGGGSNPLASVLQLALIAAAAVATSYIGGVGGALVGAAILGGGSMLVGALSGNNGLSMGQYDAANNEAASPTYSLNASTNIARLYQPLPKLYGTIQFLPDVIATPWSLYAENEMFLHQAFGCGVGYLEPHSIAFGDTVFWRDGHLVDDSAYAVDGEEYNFWANLELVAPNKGGGWTQGIAAASEYAATKKVRAVLFFPEGLYSWDHSDAREDNDGWGRGKWFIIEHSVTVDFEIREINSAGQPVSDWHSWCQHTVATTTRKDGAWIKIETGPVSFTVDLPEQTVYRRVEVRARRVTPATDTINAQERWIDSNGKVIRTEKRTRSDIHERVIWQSVSSTLAGIQVQWAEPGQPVTLFPDNVQISEAVGGQELKAPNQSGGWAGPFPVCPSGMTVNRIQNDLNFPKGIGYLDNKGKLSNYTIQWEFDCQRIDDKGNAIGPRVPLNYGNITEKTQTPQRRSLFNDVEPGRYQVWARRASNSPADTRTLDMMQWESLKGVVPGSLRYKQTVVAIRTRSSNTLSKASSERVKVIATRKLPVYDRMTKTWSAPVPTRSFAAAICHVCKAEYGARMTDSQIDLQTLWRLDEIVTAKGWTFDAWLDGPYSNFQLLTEICKAMLVIPQPAGPMLTFTMDAADRPVKHVFTPRDIVRGTLTIAYNNYDDDSPDDVQVTYLDEEASYAKRNVRAVLPTSESRQPSEQQPIGIVKREHAHAYGVHLSAGNRFRRISVNFETEGIGRLLSNGDVVSIQHPRLRDSDSGEVKDWNESALVLEVDHTPKFSTPEAYLHLTRPNGSPWGPVKIAWAENGLIKLDAEDFAAVLMQGNENPFPWLRNSARGVPTVWTIMEAREFTRRRWIIDTIKPTGPYRYAFTVTNDDPRVYDQHIPVPPWGGIVPSLQEIKS